MIDMSWLLIAIPLVSTAILLLLGRRSDAWGHWFGVLASAATFVVGALAFVELLGKDAANRLVDVHLFDWVNTGDFLLQAGIRIDPLSLTFVLLVTFVGTLIHIYSVAYMESDKDRRRFFAYLNLFIASMLILVLANSYLLLFVGWEGVGLASYLLIGFWNHNADYAAAAKKAFSMNRVADVGMILALGAMFATFGGVDFATVHGGAAAMGVTNEGMMTFIGLMLLLAACGKSAQFPLQAWLGDAMAGPTPVSALIHAATMVTAGVYLIVRSGAVFTAAPTALLVVAIVGAITLLFGAIVGCAKDDIKKVLAASTMSQIGYMMLAAGLGPIGYAFAIFHLVTHGFFKAGMFLGAGSVMHGMNDDVNMRNYGALAKTMKITWITFGLGWLAILGIPPFSGFYSKDKIIEVAFSANEGAGWQPWVFGLTTLVGAGITAFYMSRLFFMTFQGEKRWPKDAHPHESPRTMTIPMMVLAVGSASLGLILGPTNGILHWLEPVVGAAEEEHPVIPVPALMAITLLVVAAGVALAWMRYWRDKVPTTAPMGSLLTRAARADLYQDQVNEGVFMRPGIHLTRALVFLDKRGIDGAAGGFAALIGGTSSRLRRVQNGLARSYALTMLIGVVVILGAVWVVQ